MIKNLKMNYIICLLFILFSACKKNTIASSESNNNQIDTNAPYNPIGNNESSYNKIYNVGSGAGDLVIDGNSYSFDGNTLFRIKGGKYNSIRIANIDGRSNLITIQNDGLVEMVNAEMRLENLNNVKISGDGTSSIDKGFLFRDNSYRAIQVNGVINNFTLQHISFKNIKDYVFTYKYQKIYDGSLGSYSRNLKFLNINCDNTSTFFAGDGGVSGQIVGLIKGVEIAYLNFKNSAQVGSVVYFGNVEDADIHNNLVDNVNTANDNHNGIFMLKGNGKFYNNFIKNHQGNSIRAWIFSVGNTPKKILIYNNIIIGSRKYSAFEVQAFREDITPGNSTYANAEIFNNTVGNINTSRQWQGNVVDVYSLQGGYCNVFNNLAFNLNNQDSDNIYIAGQQSDLKAKEFNNLYFSTSKGVGFVDEISFRLSSQSKAKSKGNPDNLVVKDFFNNTRSSPPSVGAVE